MIDRQYLVTPLYGSRRMTEFLRRANRHVNRKHVQRLMRLMGLEAIYPKPKTSIRDVQHEVYPYLLRDLPILRRLSNTMDVQFCLTVLNDALEQGQPDIFNSDQGSQFTSNAFTQRLKQSSVQISMDGVGRCLDNVFSHKTPDLLSERMGPPQFDIGLLLRGGFGRECRRPIGVAQACVWPKRRNRDNKSGQQIRTENRDRK